MNSEDHNLGIFKILYIIKGIVVLFFAILPLLYIFFGVFLFESEKFQKNDSHIAGVLVIAVGIFVFILLLALGILTLLTARYLGKRTHYDFVFVMAIVNCLTGILGILLGIITILELNKPQVKRLFNKPS